MSKDTAPLYEVAMAHRFLYYVLGLPVIPDYEYDKLEAEAVRSAPASHPIHRPGSDRVSSYTLDQIRLAEKLAGGPLSV